MQPDSQTLRLAETVRGACLRSARQAFEDAATSGLCGEGALEAALGAIEMLDLQALLQGEARDRGGRLY